MKTEQRMVSPIFGPDEGTYKPDTRLYLDEVLNVGKALVRSISRREIQVRIPPVSAEMSFNYWLAYLQHHLDGRGTLLRYSPPLCLLCSQRKGLVTG